MVWRSVKSGFMSEVRHGRPSRVRNLLAVIPETHSYKDLALYEAAIDANVDMVCVLLDAGANLYAYKHLLEIRHPRIAPILWRAHRKQQAQLAEEKLELERQRNPLLFGLGLTLAEHKPEDMEILMREAMAEQEQPRCPARADAPEREYIPLPQL